MGHSVGVLQRDTYKNMFLRVNSREDTSSRYASRVRFRGTLRGN